MIKTLLMSKTMHFQEQSGPRPSSCRAAAQRHSLAAASRGLDADATRQTPRLPAALPSQASLSSRNPPRPGSSYTHISEAFARSQGPPGAMRPLAPPYSLHTVLLKVESYNGLITFARSQGPPGAMSGSESLTHARPGRGRGGHSDTPYHTPLVIAPLRKYSEPRA